MTPMKYSRASSQPFSSSAKVTTRSFKAWLLNSILAATPAAASSSETTAWNVSIALRNSRRLK